MNFNSFKGKENYFSIDNKRHKNNLFLLKDKNKSEKLIFSMKLLNKKKIENMKMKYGITHNNLNKQFVHRKVQLLKNKYMKESQNLDYKLKINNTIRYSINNNKINLMTRSGGKKNMFRTSSLQLVKENNFKFNNLYNTLKPEKKIKFEEINKENPNSYSQTTSEVNNINIIKNMNKSKSDYNFKYLKNIKQDFINIHNKLKDLYQKDAFNKKKKKMINMIFPISKKLYLLNEIKKDIKNVNKHFFSNIHSPKSPMITTSEYTTNMNLFSELFSENEQNNLMNSTCGITKPNLIKTFSKPKLNVPKYTNLYHMKI